MLENLRWLLWKKCTLKNKLLPANFQIIKKKLPPFLKNKIYDYSFHIIVITSVRC